MIVIHMALLLLGGMIVIHMALLLLGLVGGMIVIHMALLVLGVVGGYQSAEFHCVCAPSWWQQGCAVYHLTFIDP